MSNSDIKVPSEHDSAAIVPFDSNKAEDSLKTSLHNNNSIGTSTKVSQDESLQNSPKGISGSPAYDANNIPYYSPYALMSHPYPIGWSPYGNHYPPPIFPNYFGQTYAGMHPGLQFPIPPSIPNDYYQQHPPITPNQVPSSTSATDSTSQPPTAPVHTHPMDRIMLTVASSAHDFNRWINDFVKFLKQSNLVDIIPDEYGCAKRTPTDVEKAYIINIFNMYVPADTYPDWMKSSISEGTDLLTLILHAIGTVANKDPEEELLNRLSNITFDGSNAAFIFAAKIRSLVKNCRSSDVNIPESIICKCIMNGLKGQYLSLNTRYAENGAKVTLNLLLRDIQILYEIESKRDKPSNLRNKPKSDNVVKLSLPM
ncbi:Tkp1 protein [Vanderwaltozyma polyspora DSM 70294]|uniref:Tkp1 protein n=1 Tax=Vanderwaltozyma polyspora (strain ATCC 22028 / DSM 70294 / BCRC 21397 / CBS 2163 / NBRC 10782 / NRRL Y-8283 / UCD 57-17) TaxID=436907 RepID=A7TGC3_VANPO|nr:Tkp1 protein [Vanderwaltozyma polyspora DSM 70294]EDO18693.1 Tkp1 protein [Vanderwaltozyma polyspora DSM 70294]